MALANNICRLVSGSIRHGSSGIGVVVEWLLQYCRLSGYYKYCSLSGYYKYYKYSARYVAGAFLFFNKFPGTEYITDWSSKLLHNFFLKKNSLVQSI